MERWFCIDVDNSEADDSHAMMGVGRWWQGSEESTARRQRI